MPFFRYAFAVSSTHSDAASMVVEPDCPSPAGVMVKGSGLFFGAMPNLSDLGVPLRRS